MAPVSNLSAMRICPLCEHVQEQGDECENCGRPFAASASVPEFVEPLPDLELTREPEVGEVRVLPLPQMDPGRELSEGPRARPSAGTAREGEGRLRCANCGALSRVAARCSSCGAPQEADET